MEIKVADVAELVDARDLKSLDGNVVWVRVPPPAPKLPRESAMGSASRRSKSRYVFMVQPFQDLETGICDKCIGNPRFADWIMRHGHKGECEFDSTHGVSNTVVTVEDFAEEVDRYFRETYQLGEEYMYATEDSDNPSYDTQGEPYEDILADDLECDSNVLSAIVESLPDCSNHDIAQGADPFYIDANYERVADAEKRFRAEEEWWPDSRRGHRCGRARTAAVKGFAGLSVLVRRSFGEGGHARA
jgi:hypothetical protein